MSFFKIGNALAKFCVFVLFLAPLQAQHFHIRDTFFEHFCESDFQRLSEFFSAKKPSNRHPIFRTDANKTAGTYLILFLNRRADKLPPDATLEIFYDLARDPERHIIKFPMAEQMVASREIWIGFTENEEQNLTPHDFLAWKIQIKNIDGTCLVEKHSFLFSEKNPPRGQADPSINSSH